MTLYICDNRAVERFIYLFPSKSLDFSPFLRYNDYNVKLCPLLGGSL